MKTNRAYINCFDAISCAGTNSEELFTTICKKKETISLNSDYVKGHVVAIGEIIASMTFDELLIHACQNVLQNSNLKDFSNTLLVIGSSVGGMVQTEKIFFQDKSYKNINYQEHPIDAIAYKLKKVFKFYDDISFSTACTSSANALGYAKEVIEKGIYENVLVVGADSLSYTTVCGFHALSVLSSKPCTPFEKNREGMNVAEGIAVLLIQNEKTSSSVEICGVGYSSDAHHMTQPHPQGEGAKQAMQNAILDANIDKNLIGYINAHGTGTMANDTSELYAIDALFTHFKPYVSSTKSFTGHTLGAAGALEAIIACIAIQKSIIPPSKDIHIIENENIMYSNEPIALKLNYVLSNSFAFGGNNTSLLFGRCYDN
jgi:3-oxoacyl-[acyl-carrier-protein] synthase-1